MRNSEGDQRKAQNIKVLYVVFLLRKAQNIKVLYVVFLFTQIDGIQWFR
jgi:hypothetical protein